MYSSYSLLTSALDGVCDQRHAPAALYPREDPWTGGWVGPRAGLDTETRGELATPALAVVIMLIVFISEISSNNPGRTIKIKMSC
jgi:hypothetical protein